MNRTKTSGWDLVFVIERFFQKCVFRCDRMRGEEEEEEEFGTVSFETFGEFWWFKDEDYDALSSTIIITNCFDDIIMFHSQVGSSVIDGTPMKTVLLQTHCIHSPHAAGQK